MPSICFRRFISGSLALAFVIHTCRAHGATFPTTLTTTALDRSSSGWFTASACTTAAEGHRPNSSGSSPGSRRESHPPAPTDPHVSLSTHTARAVSCQDGALQYRQCTNISGSLERTPYNHAHARLPLRCSRLYFHLAQRTRWRSRRWQSGITAVG